MRYKEFNTNRVLEKCTNLIWMKGFGACSVNDIVSETGVNRFSLYNEFQNKEGILYAALNLYRTRQWNTKLYKSQHNGSLNDELLSIFSDFLLDEKNHPPGCFIIHAATELADHDPQVNTVLKQSTEELEVLFRTILERHQPKKEENNFIARHLVGLFCSSMCHCVIQSRKERINHIHTSIDLLTQKTKTYATHAKS